MNKLSELTFLQKFLKFFLFFDFSREKSSSNNVCLPRAKCVSFQLFSVALVVL